MLSEDCVVAGVKGLIVAAVISVCGARLLRLAAVAVFPDIDHFAKEMLFARTAILLGGGLLGMACGNWLYAVAEQHRIGETA